MPIHYSVQGYSITGTEISRARQRPGFAFIFLRIDEVSPNQIDLVDCYAADSSGTSLGDVNKTPTSVRQVTLKQPLGADRSFYITSAMLRKVSDDIGKAITSMEFKGRKYFHPSNQKDYIGFNVKIKH